MSQVDYVWGIQGRGTHSKIQVLTELTPNCTALSTTPNPLKKLTTSMVVAPYGKPLSLTLEVVPPLVDTTVLATSILYTTQIQSTPICA